MHTIYVLILSLVSLLKADSIIKEIDPSYADYIQNHEYVDDGFTPLWRPIIYKKAVNIDKKPYLQVIDNNLNAQYLYKIVTDKNLSIIQNHLTSTVYLIYLTPKINQPFEEQLSVAKLYLDSSKTKYVIKDYESDTKWSVLTGDGKGGVYFENYNPADGIQSASLNDNRFNIITDSFGNRVISVDYGSELYFYQINIDSNTSLPIVFDALVGDGLLIDSNNTLYNLEFDTQGNFKAIDMQNGTKRYVSVNKEGVVVFGSNPFPALPPVKLVKIKNTICNNLPPQSVKHKFEQCIEVDNKGKSFVRSDDTVLNITIRTPIEKLDNISVVYDFLTSYVYLVNEQSITQLFKNGSDYVIKNGNIETGAGYSKVTADANSTLSFIELNPYTNITRTIDNIVLPEENKNQLLILQYSGEKRDLPHINRNFVISRDAKHNFPVVNNPLTCEVMLVERSSAFIYRLEKNDSENYVAVGSTWQRRKFKVESNGDVEIIID